MGRGLGGFSRSEKQVYLRLKNPGLHRPKGSSNPVSDLVPLPWAWSIALDVVSFMRWNHVCQLHSHVGPVANTRRTLRNNHCAGFNERSWNTAGRTVEQRLGLRTMTENGCLYVHIGIM